MLNDARLASTCLYVRTCQRVRNSKNIATIRDFQVYIRVNSTKKSAFLLKMTLSVEQVHALYQGFQLSRIERESPSWTLFLPLSRQACKISHINEKNPAKHVKSPASVGKNPRK